MRNLINDKELLELAAKAVGYRIKTWKDTKPVCWIDDEPWIWNPLDDDGDALRLAVKLEINVLPSMEQASARNQSYTGWNNGDASRDPYAATRRVIVRAAAEIGRQIK